MCASFPILLLAAISFPASAASKNLSTPASQMLAQYHIVRAVFWHAEGKLQERIETREDCRVAYSVLPADDPLRAEYSRVASAADQYLKIADANKLPVLPAMIYLGGLAKYSLGDNSGALALLERLRSDFPDYKCDQYYNDRDAPDPEYSVPTAPGVSKLVFYLRLQVALKNTPDAFASLKQITQDALNTLALQNQYAQQIAAKSDQYNRYEFDESLFGSEPDQDRAGALPSTLALVDEAWTKLLEPALKKSGAQAMRDWLRGLSTPDAPLSKLALYHLQNIDALIIKQLFADAQQQMNAHNYDGARVRYKELIAQYPGTDAAQRASDALPKIVPVAVAYYKDEGDKNNHPERPDQLGVPQTKAREYFEEMYKEDPTGSQADYALFKWSEALGTEGKVAQGIAGFQQFLQKFPDSPHRCRVMYLLGFFNGSQAIADDKKAIEWLERVLKEYPNSLEASESLWHIAFFLIYRENRYTDAIPYLQKLQEKYPQSLRVPHVDEEIRYAHEQLAKGLGR